jgi:hypothetical protein
VSALLDECNANPSSISDSNSEDSWQKMSKADKEKEKQEKQAQREKECQDLLAKLQKDASDYTKSAGASPDLAKQFGIIVSEPPVYSKDEQLKVPDPSHHPSVTLRVEEIRRVVQRVPDQGQEGRGSRSGDHGPR